MTGDIRVLDGKLLLVIYDDEHILQDCIELDSITFNGGMND